MAEITSSRAGPRIAIVGIAGRFPGAPDVEAFWRDIRDGAERITRFTEAELRAAGVPEAILRDPAYVPAKGVLAGADQFDAALFGMSAREAELCDPQHRVFLECALAALEDAGYSRPSPTTLVGVFAGSGESDYASIGAPASRGAASHYQRGIAGAKDFLATKVSYKLDLRGPSIAVQTACSTSLIAVTLACQSLLSYQCDVALAGGVAISVPLRAGYLHQPGMVLSPTGTCRPFDADAAGTVPGDGVGAVVLRRLDDAIADGDTVLAVIRGFATNNDGAAKQSFSAPSADGQAAAIAHAMAMTGVEPETVSYVETHGTGTPLGDPIEIAALGQVFGGPRPYPCALGSVKANIGHLDAAAGIAGLIKVIQMLRYREIPPSRYLKRLSPRLGLDETPFAINTERLRWEAAPPRRAGVSSFGIGGTNAHIVLEEALPARRSDSLPARPELIALSAATETALQSVCVDLAEHLGRHPEIPLADAAYSLHIGRRSYRHRRIVIGESSERAEITRALSDRSTIEPTTDAGQTTHSVVFLFPGHGSAFPEMGRSLYERWPSYRADIDEGIELLGSRAGVDLRPALFPSSARDRDAADAALAHSRVGQPATFLVEVAVARLLLSWGVRPCALLGHSLGEYAAACVAGVFSLEDGLSLVAERGALIARAPEGSMLAVELAPEALSPMLGADLSVAAVNGPSRCVVAGPPRVVAALERALAGRGVDCRRLRSPHAFHSRLMDGIIEPLINAARRIPLRAPELPILSCITGDRLTPEGATDPAYWGRHLREQVRFDVALARSCEAPSPILVEVGPGDTLTALARRHSGIDVVEALTSMRRRHDKRSDAANLLEAAGRLWMRDVPIDLAAIHAEERRRRVRLPSYPFERQRYWREVEPALSSAMPASAGAGKRDVSSWFYEGVWRPSPRRSPDRIVEGHSLIFADAAGLGAEVQAALPPLRVTQVRPGVQFEQIGPDLYTIRPDEPEDYAALVAELDRAGELPDSILFLWSADTNDAPLNSELDRGLLGVTRLIRALSAARPSRSISLLIVTRGAQPVAGAPVQRPAQAMTLALSRVIPSEYPHIRCRSIDLGVSSLSEGARRSEALDLIHELGILEGSGKEPPIAYREGQRYELAVEQARELNESSGLPRSLPGACLITGGLGGIGLVLARRLAALPEAKLVLISRAGLPPRSNWADILADNPAPEPDSIPAQIRAVLDIADAGADVLVIAADVTSEPEMKRVLEAARGQFGSISGIIHAAGIASGGVIARQSDEEIRRALAPKVQGALVVDHLTRGEPLEFFALCSSLTAITGGFGQLAYTAANCFLDAFASALRGRGVRAVSIGWDGWTDVGMAARAARSKEDSSTIDLADRIHSSEGPAIFERALGSGRAHLVISVKPLDEPVGALSGPAAIQAPASSAHRRSARSRPRARAELVPPQGPLQEVIATHWRGALGIDEIGIHNDFFELGGDSLLAIQLLAELRQKLGADLPPHILAEIPTIAGLSTYIEEQRAGRPTRAAGEEEPARKNRAKAQSPSADTLVCLREGAGDRPLFLFHPVGGQVYIYRDLVASLPRDLPLPIYGVRARAPGADTSNASIPALAASYIRDLRAIQPCGPYLLGGSSLGGVIAYETARQLAEADEATALLAMLDSPGPGCLPPMLEDDAGILAYLLSQGRPNPEELARLRGLSREELVEHFLRLLHARSGNFQASSVLEVLSLLEVWRSNQRALVTYEPAPYPGNVLFFSATESDGINVAHPERAWLGLARGGVEAHPVPGTHISMNYRPNTAVIAKILGPAIAQALAGR